MSGPVYWMYERAAFCAIEAYLSDDAMTFGQIASVRAYLRHWIEKGDWRGPDIDGLKLSLDALVNREAISLWLGIAMEIGIDPL